MSSLYLFQKSKEFGATSYPEPQKYREKYLCIIFLYPTRYVNIEIGVDDFLV